LKKIDLHIHTIPTISDSHFDFSLDTFKKYVSEARLDAVAITNHDLFDGYQFRLIQEELDIAVFPGIEINVDKGHVLIIGNASELDDFEVRAGLVSNCITKSGDSISVHKLKEIFGDLGKYLVIPHYEKAPPITGDTLASLLPYVCAGEVDSPKKFVRAMKDAKQLTPVLFSDSRMKNGLVTWSTRQTFVDCGTPTIGALKTCLKDKAKVALSERDGNKLWQVFNDGQTISTGLNVLVGARSSGKTHTLNEISKYTEKVKYIEQFQLVQQDDAAYERDFRSNIEKRRSAFVDQYLSGFKRVLEDVIDVSLSTNDRDVGKYVESLIRAAEDADRKDAFSKASLFDEVDFPIGNTKTLHDLIESVKQVIENIEFRSVIEKHVEIASLKSLACELIELFRSRNLENDKRKLVNSLVKDIKQGLKVRTASVQVEDVDLYRVAMDTRRVQRFTQIVGLLKKETVVFEETVQGFRIEAKREPYGGAGELKTASGLKTAFGDAFRKYDSPYEFLQELLTNEALSRSNLYKLFVKIGYKILNREGFEVSGGERSEFRLLQEIADAQNFDILLIDEPESSFDNLFLRSDVNKILKAIAESMPVVVVTHNNTVGASVGADYLLHTRRELEGGKIVYRIYSGYPTDAMLTSVDGKSINSHEVLLDSLEAGVIAYEGRRKMYEAIKN